MLYIIIKTFVLFGFVLETSPLRYRNNTCGIDKSKISFVYEGIASIEDYPWMGTLFYPIPRGRMTASVVLVTKQIVIGSANEIDTLPKYDIRSRSRVVLGSKCSGPSLKIRDYALHPDFKDYPHSTLALVQLEVDVASIELRPICSPPTFFIEPEFYAMVAGDCNKGKMRIFKMRYVPQERCQTFYRKFESDNSKFWPKHTTCARAVSPRACRWRSGAALVIKQDGRWRLLGFGLHGPGCNSPARFLDYGMQEAWVRKSVARIGLPAITRVGDGHIILRRSLGNLQRFGYCDFEERRNKLYTEQVEIEGTFIVSKTSYNLTLNANTEYACVVLRAKALEEYDESFDEFEESTTKPITESTELPTTGFTTRGFSTTELLTTELLTTEPTTARPKKKHPCPENPMLYLRRWCAGSTRICYGFQYIEINFFVDIVSEGNTTFTITAYGKIATVINPDRAMKYANELVNPIVVEDYSYEYMLKKLISEKNAPRKHHWFYT